MPPKGIKNNIEISGAKTEDDSLEEDTKSSPHSSEAEVEGGRVGKILVSNKIIRNGDNISVRYFINSEQRADTNLVGNSQGDHAIGYVEILFALLGSANSKGIRSAINSTLSLVHSSLESEGVAKLQEIREPKVHERDERRKIMIALSANPDPAIRKLAEQNNRELKYSKVSQLANYLCEISSCFLSEIQKEDLTTFYSKGRIKASSGDLEKGASRALVALDMICELCDIMDEERFAKKLEHFKRSLTSRKKDSGDTEEDHIARYGLNRWFDDGVRKADSLLNDLDIGGGAIKNKLSLMALRDELLAKTENIAGFIGGLVDYQKTIRFDLDEAISLTEAEKRESKQEQNQVRRAKIRNIFSEEDGHKIDFESVSDNNFAIVTRTGDENLIKVLSKSLKIFSAAFPNMVQQLKQTNQSHGVATTSISSPKFDDVRNLFLEKEIIGKQGWTEVRVKKANISLTREYLSQKIDELEKRQVTKAQQRERSRV